MNKNTIIGSILLFGLFMGMTWWNTKTATEREKARQEQLAKQLAENPIASKQEAELSALADSLTLEQKDSLVNALAQKDSLQAVKHFGALVEASKGESQIITLENEVLALDINTQGGMIERVILKEFINNLDSTQLELFSSRNNSMDLSFEGLLNGDWGQFIRRPLARC